MRYRLYSVISLFLITIMGIMSAFTIKAEDLPKVIVATDASLPPMEFLNSKGNIKGFDIEVMNAIAKEAGFKVEYRNTKWNNIFAGLKSSRFDAAISCIIVTRERAKRYAFSIP
ncbi:MAG TPA: transporter substrate-binding domain-containing protein, partial [Deltaproteobacteria bacterium]|nr:transporter substrate-binding domain-containing protein [Deltaproteobacteria bacterium]